MQCCGKTNLLDEQFSESQTGGTRLLPVVGQCVSFFPIIIKTGTKMQTAEVGTYWSMWHFTGRKEGLDDALENTPAH